MKKLVLSVLFLLGFVSNSYATGSVGFTISNADVESVVKDDIDNNVTLQILSNLFSILSFIIYNSLT